MEIVEFLHLWTVWALLGTFGHFRYSGHLRLILGLLSTLGAFEQLQHFWALRGTCGDLLVSAMSNFRAKSVYLGGS